MTRGFQGWTLPYAAPNLNPATPQPGDYQWAIQARESSLSYPDLTRFVEGKWPLVVNPDNSTTVPAAITTVDNWSVATGFSAGTQLTIAPTSGFTPHGIWGDLVMTPPTLSTLATSGSPTVLSSVLLDTNLGLLLFRDNNDVKVVAFRPDSGEMGTPVDVNSGGNYTAGFHSVFRRSATEFFVATVTSAGETFVAGSVTTLAVSIGSPAISGNTVVDCVQLNDNLFLTQAAAANGLRGVVVSGNTVTVGAAQASGSIGDGTGLTVLRIARSSNTEGLACYISTGGGTTTTRALSARVVTVDAGTAAITLQAATAGGNVLRESIRTITSLTEGSKYIISAQNTTATSGSFYPVDVSTTTATVGTVTTRATDLPASTNPVVKWIYPPGIAAIRYDGSTALFGHLTTGIYAASSAGGALTFSSTLAMAAAKTFVKDFAGNNFYATGGAVFDKITVSAGPTVASTWQVAAVPSFVINDYLTDKAVSYNGTWYSWSLGTWQAVVAPATVLYVSGNNITFNGPIY